MRGNHPGEGKREQQPEKAPPAPAVRPKWSSPGWEHPQRHSWPGGSCGSAGVSHSQPLRASSRISHSTSAPGIGGQISSSRSGMFSLSLECCSVGWQCWQHPGPAQGMCRCWEPRPAQLCRAVLWWPCLAAAPSAAVPSPPDQRVTGTRGSIGGRSSRDSGSCAGFCCLWEGLVWATLDTHSDRAAWDNIKGTQLGTVCAVPAPETHRALPSLPLPVHYLCSAPQFYFIFK